jgi:tetratricopeptide (TPR) repeat protein
MEDFLKQKLKYAREQLEVHNYFRAVEGVRRLIGCKVHYFAWQGHLIKGEGLFHLGQIEEALNNFESALALEPKDEETQFFAIDCLIDLERFLEARTRTISLQNLFPESTAYLDYLVTIDQFLGDHQSVIQHCDQLIESNPTESAYYTNRSNAKLNLGYLVESLEDYLEAKRLTKDKGDLAMINNNIGYIYSRMEHYSRARDYLEKSLQYYEEFASALNNLGWVLHKQKQTDKGLEKIRQSLKIDPYNPYAYKNRAKIFLDLGQMKKAKVDLLKAKSLDYELLYGSEVNELITRYHFAD